jgi:hypothetical protein
MPAVCTLHPVFTEVSLGILAEGKLRQLVVRPWRTLEFRNGILGTDMYHIVKNSLAANALYLFAVRFFQMILYLLTGVARAAAELI